MREPSEHHPRSCPRVAWSLERLDLRFPTHGGEECRATGRGVEVHACRRQAGHEEDLVTHLCCCGLAWTDEAPALPDADGKMAGSAGPAAESVPEGNPLGEVVLTIIKKRGIPNRQPGDGVAGSQGVARGDEVR